VETGLAPAVVVSLVAWGTIVGVDLVSAPQGLLSRPLVAAAVSGWLLGDVAAGLQVGLVLECFALDVLPVGAAKYPDYGPGAVGATLFAAGRTGLGALGVATGIGLAMALIGGWSLLWIRHANTRAVRRRAAALAAGDRSAILGLQRAGLLRDIARSAGLTLLALGLALAARRLTPGEDARMELVGVAAIGAALAAVTAGAIRSAGRGPRLAWLGAGALIGLLWVAVG
jgi:mannose/fructose/N-acetylgalactosamine-specific phosphotransferase system component IIC